MIYDPKKELDVQNAKLKFDKLINGDKPFELKEKRMRSLNQNSLFHLWIKVFADFIGEPNLDACKRDIKRELLGTKGTFYSKITRKDEIEDYHTSEMSDQELSSFMDKFKSYAATEWNCYLPYIGDVGFNEMLSQYEY